MRKLFTILVSALLVLGISIQARAEQSTSTFTGKRFEEQQVFVYAYNNGSTEVQSYGVVIIDTDGTAGSTLGTYIENTTDADDELVFGVAAETIAVGSVGKVCVRGPHEVYDDDSTHAVSSILSSSTTANRTATYSTADATVGGFLGLVIGATSSLGPDYAWIWVRPQVHK